ncbi:putative integral membrane protein [Naviculisporaceae sp. PSN 640]
MASAGPPPQLPPGAYDDMSGTVIGVVAFCLVFSTIMVALRLFTRVYVVKLVGIDDYAAVISLFVIYAAGIPIALMTQWGSGKHIYALDPASLPELVPNYLREFYFTIVFYCAALMTIKLTFLLGYYRVLAVQHMRVVYIVAMFVVGGWSLSQVFVGIFTCTPISGFWDKSIPSACIPNLPQWYINAAGNIITDVAVFVLPLPALWKLNLARPQKLALVGIFCLGFFTVVVSVIRIRYLRMFEDFTWENAPAGCWSIGELTSAITCCCLPTLRPLLTRYFPSLGSRIGRSSKGYAQTFEHGTGATSTIGQKSVNRKGGISDGGDSEIELGIGNKGGDAASIGRASTSAASVGREHITSFQSTVRTNISPFENAQEKTGRIQPGDIVVQREVHLSTSIPR